jgi:hypothetical protein
MGEAETMTAQLPLAPSIDPVNMEIDVVDGEFLRREAQIKPANLLTPDEVLFYCPNRFFPKVNRGFDEVNEPRNYHVSLYADSFIHGSLRQIKKDHAINAGTIRYLMIRVGLDTIEIDYPEKIAQMKTIIDWLDENGNVGVVDGIPRHTINQTGGYIKQTKSGFTESDSERISEASEILGLTESSFLLVCYWVVVVKCDRLRQDYIKYGKNIIRQFEEHLEDRIEQLQKFRKRAEACS